MESKYAYMVYTTDFDDVEPNKDGELIQLNEQAYAGQTDLVSISNYKSMVEDFPDRIKGGIISQDNLLNVIRQLFEGIEKDYNSLATKSEYTKMRFDEFKHVLDYVIQKAGRINEMKGWEKTSAALGLETDITAEVNDLANKFFVLQEEVRKEQRKNKELNSMVNNTMDAPENSNTAKKM